MIAIGCDHGGYKLKEEIKKYLDEKEIEYIDCGCMNEERVDYPNIAKEVALSVQNGLGMIVFFGCTIFLSLAIMMFSKYSLKRSDVLKVQLTSARDKKTKIAEN